MSLSKLLFSSRCKLCNRQTTSLSVCNACDYKLKSKINPGCRRVYVDLVKVDCFYLFDYSDKTVQKLLYALKRNADKGLIEYASHLYQQAFPEKFDAVVTNVPRRRVNVRNFGYDQVQRPCKMAAENCNLKFERLFKRRGFSRNQKNLDFLQRQKNIHGKFRVIKKDIPKNILLADDVLTTASTFKECVSVLLEKNPCVNIKGVFLASSNGAGFSGE